MVRRALGSRDGVAGREAWGPAVDWMGSSLLEPVLCLWLHNPGLCWVAPGKLSVMGSPVKWDEALRSERNESVVEGRKKERRDCLSYAADAPEQKKTLQPLPRNTQTSPPLQMLRISTVQITYQYRAASPDYPYSSSHLPGPPDHLLRRPPAARRTTAESKTTSWLAG